MATQIVGRRMSELDRDNVGHRTYKIKHLVKSDVLDGPANVLQTAGLPEIGSFWQFDNDIDIWAICLPNAKVRRTQDPDEPGEWWEVEQVFSTNYGNRCQDTNIEDPLLEPDRVGGSYVKFTREFPFDKDGNAIVNSGFELVKGPLVEFDDNRPTVWIEQNVADLELDTFSELIDHVNDSVLWGLGPRKIKLSNITWERRVFGSCTYYYTRTFEFDVNFAGFDRTGLDEGTKVLRGKWVNNGTEANPDWEYEADPTADPDNPKDYDDYVDTKENPSTIIYSAEEGKKGQPWDGTYLPSSIDVVRYSEADFLQLGITPNLG